MAAVSPLAEPAEAVAETRLISSRSALVADAGPMRGHGDLSGVPQTSVGPGRIRTCDTRVKGPFRADSNYLRWGPDSCVRPGLLPPVRTRRLVTLRGTSRGIAGPLMPSAWHRQCTAGVVSSIRYGRGPSSRVSSKAECGHLLHTRSLGDLVPQRSYSRRWCRPTNAQPGRSACPKHFS